VARANVIAEPLSPTVEPNSDGMAGVAKDNSEHIAPEDGQDSRNDHSGEHCDMQRPWWDVFTGMSYTLAFLENVLSLLSGIDDDFDIPPESQAGVAAELLGPSTKLNPNDMAKEPEVNHKHIVLSNEQDAQNNRPGKRPRLLSDDLGMSDLFQLNTGTPHHAISGTGHADLNAGTPHHVIWHAELNARTPHHAISGTGHADLNAQRTCTTGPADPSLGEAEPSPSEASSHNSRGMLSISFTGSS
jgi:hypothetical protein